MSATAKLSADRKSESRHASSRELGCLRIKDGFYAPKGVAGKSDLVYDHQGRLVIESCVRRGADKEDNVSEPRDTLSDDLCATANYYDGPLLFLGAFQHPHFGHFITEGLARLWVLLDDGVVGENVKIATSKHPYSLRAVLKSTIQLPSNRFLWPMLAAFDLRRNRFLVFRNVIQAEEIIVPDCTFYMRGESSPRHYDVTCKIARKTLRASDAEASSSRPVYLSRRLLKRSTTTYYGEDAIEAFAKESGFSIVHTQFLTHRQSVSLFNTHDRFVGLIGSAFHNLLYRISERPAQAVYLYAEDRNVVNYRMVDDITGTLGQYEVVCTPKDIQSKTFVCDVDKSISVLRDLAKAWA